MVSVRKCFGHFVPPLSLIRVKNEVIVSKMVLENLKVITKDFPTFLSKERSLKSGLQASLGGTPGAGQSQGPDNCMDGGRENVNKYIDGTQGNFYNLWTERTRMSINSMDGLPKTVYNCKENLQGTAFKCMDGSQGTTYNCMDGLKGTVNNCTDD